MALAFLLGRALPGVPGAPLGLAFWIALQLAGARQWVVLLSGLAVLAGVWSLPSSETLGVLGTLSGLLAARVLYGLGQRKGIWQGPVAAIVIGSVSVAVPSLLGTLTAGHDSLLFIRLLFFSGVAGLFSLIFFQGVDELRSERVFHVGHADIPLSTMLIAGAAMCGLQGLPRIAGLLSPWEIAASLLVLVGAYSGGYRLAAAAAGVIGMALLAGNIGLLTQGTATVQVAFQETALLIVRYLLTGMLAGWFNILRWPGVVVAFLLGLIITTGLTEATADPLVESLLHAGVAALILLLLPRRWLTHLPGALADAPDPSARKGSLPSNEDLEDRVAEKVRGLATVLREVHHTLQQVAVVSEVRADEPDVAKGAVEQAVSRICQTCSMRQHCWGAQAEQTQEILSNLWHEIRTEGPLLTQAMPQDLGRICIYPKEMVHTFNYLFDLHRTHQYWERRFEEGRLVVGDYLRNIARILDRLGNEVSIQPHPDQMPKVPAIRLVSGVARLARKGNLVSGDAFIGEGLETGQYLLALSDGMGDGQTAATQSRQCVRLVKNLLGAGFGTEVTVQTVNSALLLRSPEDSFATVDLTLVDLGTCRAEFVKIGAAPSFIIRDGDVTVVKSATVPIGIINQVQVEPEFRNLRPGDLIVMVTDGIWDVSRNETDKERWLIDHLKRTRVDNPTDLADSVIARALELTDRDAADDMTVLVAAVELADIQGARVPARNAGSTGSWASAKPAPRRRSADKEAP